MLVRVERVASLPGGLSIFFDDQPDSLVIWVLEDECSEDQAANLEMGFNVLVWYWLRKPAALRANLRAV